MIEVRLSKGYTALIDDEDASLILSHKWSAAIRRSRNTREITRVYAVRVQRVNGKQRAILMHRQIMGEPGGDVDHRDPSLTLDNRRSNLRVSTRAQNNANARKRAGTSSAHKGVFFHRQTGKWCAQIANDGVSLHLGLFDDEDCAAQAYRDAANKYYGEFARC